MKESRRAWRARVLIALVGAGAVSMIASSAGQQRGGQAAGQQQGGGRGNFASMFTGKIAVADSSNMSMSRIRFEAGARTNWHTHTAGQILLVEEGLGRLYEQGGGIVVLKPGQPVLTKPNVLHWHGAAPEQHAVQFSVYSGELKWADAVSDDEYLGKKKR